MDGFSVAALVLGICGLFFGWLWVIPPVLGVVFGGVSLHRINQSNNWKSGRGMAIAGLTCGIVGTVIWGLIFIATIGAHN
jgi:Domain of unknown function (DUF4190)